MAAAAYLEELQQQLVSFWLERAASQTDDGADEGNLSSGFCSVALFSCMAQFLQTHGRTESLVTCAHELPATGATSMDVVIASREFHLLGARTRASTTSTLLWERTVEECMQAGCKRVLVSKLLLPGEDTVTATLVRCLYEWFPNDLRVRPTDTKETLLKRIAACQFLDDIGVPPHLSKRRGAPVRLNATMMQQPRRATFSVQAGPVHTIAHSGIATDVVELYHYYEFKHARVMPPVLFDLSTAVWRAAYHVLSDVSRLCPFNHCQLLVYYECFRNRINQHRDNSNSNLLKGLLQKLDAEQNCDDWWDIKVPRSGQVAGSDVVIYTLGTCAMNMVLRFPHADNLFENRSAYVVDPSFCIRLAAGTIFVWNAIDDIFFTHEAFFESEDDPCLCVSDSGWREAYVFRHVRSVSLFHCAVDKKHAVVDDPDMIAKRQKRRRAAVARARRDLFKSIC